MDTKYLFQVLCLLTLVAVPLSLSKRHFSRIVRLAIAMVPVLFGVVYSLFTGETNGIFVALIGLWAVFFVTVHPAKREDTINNIEDDDASRPSA